MPQKRSKRGGAREPAIEPRGLVAQIIAGSSEAEAALVERYRRPVRAVLRQKLYDEADVEDFVQETLGLGLEKIRCGELRDPDRLGPYLMSLARNLVIEHFRRRARRKTESDSEALERQVSSASSPDDLLLEDERANLVRQVMGELEKTRDRDILMRFYLREEDKTSICQDLGLTSLHFNRVLHRARQRYRKLYEEHLGRPLGTLSTPPLQLGTDSAVGGRGS